MSNDYRTCLDTLDVEGMRSLWAKASPHLPQPSSHEEALAAMHAARTAAWSIPFDKRAYSHRWLTERALPSQLPDHLKPSAERIYPRIVASVGVAVKSQHAEVKAAITGVMEYVIKDCYANGDTAPEIVKPLMLEARAKERRALGIARAWDR